MLSQFPKREWERTRGLYIVEQVNLGRGYQSVRCGMAGQRSGDVSSGSIGARMQDYLNVWKPTDGKVHALLVVRDYSDSNSVDLMENVAVSDENEYMGIGNRSWDPKTKRRTPYYTPRLKHLESKFHAQLVADGVQRLDESEFFKGSIDKMVASLRNVKNGTLYVYNSMKKTWDVEVLTETQRGKTVALRRTRDPVRHRSNLDVSENAPPSRETNRLRADRGYILDEREGKRLRAEFAADTPRARRASVRGP